MKYSVYVRKYEERKQLRRMKNIGEVLCMIGFMAALIAGCFADAHNLTVFVIAETCAVLLMAAGGFICGRVNAWEERR